jgi:hypothetical protein
MDINDLFDGIMKSINQFADEIAEQRLQEKMQESGRGPEMAALVPKPRVHLTRYHGVFAPHSALRAQVTPAGRGKKTGVSERSPAERHQAMTWAQRLKRVFRIDIESCECCGGKVRIIASVEDPAVIGKILAHLEHRMQVREAPANAAAANRPRGPPGQGEFDLN